MHSLKLYVRVSRKVVAVPWMCLGVEAVTRECIGLDSGTLRNVTSSVVIRGLTIWHAEMNLGGETITQPTRDMRFPAQGCSIYSQTSPLLGRC